MSCNQGHITHPEHWHGDEGDVVQALAEEHAAHQDQQCRPAWRR